MIIEQALEQCFCTHMENQSCWGVINLVDLSIINNIEDIGNLSFTYTLMMKYFDASGYYFTDVINQDSGYRQGISGSSFCLLNKIFLYHVTFFVIKNDKYSDKNQKLIVAELDPFFSVFKNVTKYHIENLSRISLKIITDIKEEMAQIFDDIVDELLSESKYQKIITSNHKMEFIQELYQNKVIDNVEKIFSCSRNEEH